MCPQASGAGGGAGKGGAQPYKDHDTTLNVIQPPIQNTWYTMFHDFNVRLIWCTLIQINDETAQHQVEIRWTIDGNVYDLSFLANNNTV